MNLQQIFIAPFIICFIQATYVGFLCCVREYDNSETTHGTCCKEQENPNNSLRCEDLVFETFETLWKRRCELLKGMLCKPIPLQNTTFYTKIKRIVHCVTAIDQEKESCGVSKCWPLLTGDSSGESCDNADPPRPPSRPPTILDFEGILHSIVLSHGTYISKRLCRMVRGRRFELKNLRMYQERFRRMKEYLDLGENDKCKEWIKTTTEAFDEYFTNQSSDSNNVNVSIEDALTFFADMTSDYVEPNTCNSSLTKKVLQSLVLSIVDLSENNTDNLKQITGDTINVNSNNSYNGSKHGKQGNIKVIHITMNMNNVSLNFTKTNTIYNTTYLLISDIKTIKVVADGINGSNVNASINFKIKDDHKRMGAECFFWNETKREWSKTGVKTVEMNNSLVKCISDHLTSFAIFASSSEFPRTDIHSTVLNIISLIGCGFSLFGVVLTLMVYALFSKTVTILRTIHYKAHINLLLSLGLMQTAFIVGINIANYKIGCKIAAVMLHYFSLTSFCWMGVEGVILYLKIIRVFNSEVVTVKLFYLFTWGIPMVFVGTVASFYFDDYGSNNVCWLTFQEYFVMWAFVAPSGLIVLMNMIVLCLVLWVAIKTSKSRKAKDRTKSVLKHVCILSPILGVTWLFGILAFTHESVVWQYAFAICNSLQGFVIFVIYGLAKKELRDAIIRKFFIQINDHSTHTSNKIHGF